MISNERFGFKINDSKKIMFSPVLLNLKLSLHVTSFIIQQIVTMPIYGKETLNNCYPYVTDILRYT